MVSKSYISRWWFHVCFTFHPGEMIQFDEHIFQMGWFNQQLVMIELQFIVGEYFWKGCVSTTKYKWVFPKIGVGPPNHQF